VERNCQRINEAGDRFESDDPFSVTVELPWWCHPLVPPVLIFPLALYVAAADGPDEYALWGTIKYLDSHLVLQACLVFLGFLLGIAFGSSRIENSGPLAQFTCLPIVMSRRRVAACDRFANILFMVALIAYAVWVMSALLHGASIAQVRASLGGQEGALSHLKRLATPIAGVTTFTQVAPVCLAIRVFLRRIGFDQRPHHIFVLLLLSVARSFLYGERLALIEMVVPLGLVTTMIPRGNVVTPRRRWVTRSVPFLAVPALWLMFAVFEYWRSWTHYKGVFVLSYSDFVTQRLLGYYVTAINNSALYSALYRSAAGASAHPPYFTFPALWDAPVLSTIMGTPSINGMNMSSWWMNLLSFAANPEFNNKGTFLVVAADLGTAGAFIYWMIFGGAIGLLYASIRRGSLVGLLAYACAFVGLLEVSRIIYWGQGRFTPSAIALVIFAAVIPNLKVELEPQDNDLQLRESVHRISPAPVRPIARGFVPEVRR
jgi:oligosaccharide repeat unit polymerase